MSNAKNPYEQRIKFVAEAIMLTSIFLGIILKKNVLKIAYEIIEESKE